MPTYVLHVRRSGSDPKRYKVRVKAPNKQAAVEKFNREAKPGKDGRIGVIGKVEEK